MEQKYICRYCGKECKNENSLRNHERLCKMNPDHQQHTGFVYGWTKGLNKENSEVYKKISEKAKAKYHKKFIPYFCEKCGKLVEEKYGSGRFCSRECANSHIHTEQQNNKISDSLYDFYNKHRKTIKTRKKICVICGKEFEPTRTQKNKISKSTTCGDECMHKLRSNRSYYSQQKLIKEGKHKGWTTRNIESFAERFFKKVLENNKINYEFNKPIEKNKLGIQENGCYFLDFALSNKIDLEIDGKQHKLEDRRAHDKIRDERLTNNGWKVYRIEWKSLPKNNEYIKNEIDKFLEWYQKEGQVAQE